MQEAGNLCGIVGSPLSMLYRFNGLACHQTVVWTNNIYDGCELFYGVELKLSWAARISLLQHRSRASSPLLNIH